MINFICTANICRSPMAEYLFAEELKKLAQKDPKWAKLKSVSTGVAANDGNPISPNSQKALMELGIDASAHKSRFLTQELLDESLAVFCMTSMHKLMIEMRYDTSHTHVHLLRDFLKGDVEREVGDPYGGTLEEYRHCREQIAEAMPSVVSYLKKLI